MPYALHHRGQGTPRSLFPDTRSSVFDNGKEDMPSDKWTHNAKSERRRKTTDIASPMIPRPPTHTHQPRYLLPSTLSFFVFCKRDGIVA